MFFLVWGFVTNNHVDIFWSGIAGLCRFCMCLVLVNIARYFLKWLYQFIVPRALYKSYGALRGKQNNSHIPPPPNMSVCLFLEPGNRLP